MKVLQFKYFQSGMYIEFTQSLMKMNCIILHHPMWKQVNMQEYLQMKQVVRKETFVNSDNSFNTDKKL